ncbi:MAG TPA: hypothetical protein DCF68_12985 [Cyanothece sp. UBA12306]|nr:hypothetical protein [Cyanothece sp. UBA12306]
MAGQKPRQGWIYYLRSDRIFLNCKFGHVHLYDLNQNKELICQELSCNYRFNYLQIFREHGPHIVWKVNLIKDDFNARDSLIVIPLTTREHEKGLPTVYPLNPTLKHGFEQKLFTLIHRIYEVDVHCLKDRDGNWLQRIGQLDKVDKEAITKRLKYCHLIQQDFGQDCIVKNSSPNTLKNMFIYLANDLKNTLF